MLKALADFLRNNKERIVRTRAVLTEDLGHTNLGTEESFHKLYVPFHLKFLVAGRIRRRTNSPRN